MTQTRSQVQNFSVWQAKHFVVAEGVADGEPLSFADELVLDDTYMLAPDARPHPMTLEMPADGGPFHVAQASQTGLPAAQIYLDCCITLMSTDGTTYEGIVLVEVVGGGVEEIYLLPLADLHPKTPYRLVGIDRQLATTRFAEAASVSFTRGTHITMASGAQVRIEDVRIGDRVLTRNDGPQPVRWIGETTLRAVGEFAPVVVKAGTLHNQNDLVLSPDHRLFIYQRQDKLGAGRSEVLVKVRHLINGKTVYQRDGGFVDYFQLLFDQHQIIYAEGIAAESMLIDHRTRAALPKHLDGIAEGGHGFRPHMNYEVQKQLVSHPDAVALLKRASRS
ncbi:Hint domain-containing protein [Salipiger sp. IMCC34102]|uniref:Hint domain-containing protein n=1 Tax=Salipiger sp. IMCC34102 TaxID=2510647 RepID=UPI00101C86A8|nr:Hint domain-containing protein [Salipiger sp. IMCC34102]RYH03253.1 Hint domain-containing protein [Salipiger sp. IMCC34102]